MCGVNTLGSNFNLTMEDAKSTVSTGRTAPTVQIGCTFTDLWWSPILHAVKSGLIRAAAVLALSTCARCVGRWGECRAEACVCHVTFSSSVNVVDYFLRDQNWLPRIRPPSIFGRQSRMQGKAMWSGGLMGKKAAPLPEQVTKQSGNSLLNLRLSGDYADLSRKHSEKNK